MDFNTETITILRRGGDSWPDTLQNRLKCAKNLYLSHRFFYKIRQIHSFFNVFRQNLQILCRNQAPSNRPPGARFPLPSRRAPAAHLARNPVHSKRFRTRNPASTRNGCRVEITFYLYAPRATDLRCCAWLQPAHTGAPHVPAPRARALTCTRRSPYQQQRRSRPCQSSL